MSIQVLPIQEVPRDLREGYFAFRSGLQIAHAQSYTTMRSSNKVTNTMPMPVGGKPHEKADPETICRLQQIFDPVRSEADHEIELLKDRETTWFGFGRDSSGHPVFQDYGRFAAIMSESRTGETTDRHPQLVSFIGETGELPLLLFFSLAVSLHDR